MKPIRITDAQKRTLVQEFADYVQKLRVADSKISFTRALDAVVAKTIKKPHIIIEAAAYLKMMYLVQSTSDEIGWHGTVYRTEHLYRITDIVVYPQEVSASTVTTDDKEYGNWLIKEIPEEVHAHLRFQGHSHINMGTSPSQVDENMYENILQALPDNEFYIFCIMNKRLEINWLLYDFTQDVIFETKDITWNIILSEEENLVNWLEKQQKLITKRTWTQTTSRVNWRESYYGQEDNEAAVLAEYKKDMAGKKPKAPVTANVKGGK